MKRFYVVFAREFLQTVRSKTFKVLTVTFVIILVGAAFMGIALSNPALLFGQNSTDYTDGTAVVDMPFVLVDDRTGTGLGARLRDNVTGLRIEERALTAESIEALINDGTADACVVIIDPLRFELYEHQADLLVSSGVGEKIKQSLSEINAAIAMESHGLDAAAIEEVFASDDVWYSVSQVARDGFNGYNIGMYVYNYVMIMLMYMAIGLYGQMVATRVASEKSFRTMEVLATSVSPVELLSGKVLGVGAAGLLQISAFVGVGAVVLRVVAGNIPMLSVMAGQMLAVPAGDLICLALFFVLGFLMYAFIFGAMGSMVSQLDDLSGILSLPMYLFMLGYAIAMIGSAGGAAGWVMNISSFVPFWSPVTMLSRMAMEAVPLWQKMLSIGLLALTTVLMAPVSARIYRTGMLRYGKPPRIREIIKAARRGKR